MGVTFDSFTLGLIPRECFPHTVRILARKTEHDYSKGPKGTWENKRYRKVRCYISSGSANDPGLSMFMNEYNQRELVKTGFIIYTLKDISKTEIGDVVQYPYNDPTRFFEVFGKTELQELGKIWAIACEEIDGKDIR